MHGQRLERPCKFYRCSNVTRRHGLVQFYFEDIPFRGIEFADDDDVYQRELTVIIADPVEYRGHEVHIDLTAHGQGFFTFMSSATLEQDSCCILALFHRRKKVLALHGCIESRGRGKLHVTTPDSSFSVLRYNYYHWGPDLFRGVTKDMGIVTLYV